MTLCSAKLIWFSGWNPCESVLDFHLKTWRSHVKFCKARLYVLAQGQRMAARSCAPHDESTSLAQLVDQVTDVHKDLQRSLRNSRDGCGVKANFLIFALGLQVE